ncbi:protein of unknown function (DUF4371) [Popillia japonica]|uniref:HAT C-terminal dimerisation domain-containing protein n=1 Tax=Popillia japonica TaxID=7064 RepID=A0AAW1LTR7_POPJA
MLMVYQPVFKGSSKTIQNELLDAMLMVYQEQVSSEIKAADFISVIADEMTDVSNQFQLVIVNKFQVRLKQPTSYRYIVNGRPVERFWKFLIPNRGDDANSLSASILNEINSLVGDPQKVIAQSYDGAAVMSGAIHGVQRHLRDHYPRANFVHCYAHETNLIISHATSTSLNCRIFFANLNGLCQFFSASPQQRLEEFLPRSSKINTTVNAIYEHRLGIIEALERIEEEASLQTTIREAGANLRILGEENFIYWLSFFHKIMPHVEKFFRRILSTDDQLVIKEENDSDHQPSKRRRLTDGGQRWRETIEVCDIILREIKTRFRYTGHLILANLISFKQFSSFQKKFPEDCLKEAVKFYPCLNESRLRTQLSVLYSREEFRQNKEVSAVGLLGLLLDGLSDTFNEVVKLLKIIITIPMTTPEADRQFSLLKRIKTFLANTRKEDRLNALTMLSCEKEFINDFPNFNEKVIELFCKSQTRQMDFVYRQM